MVYLSLVLLISCGEANEDDVSDKDLQSFTDHLPSDFDVQGHRGARGLKPENTLQAFETALDLGVTTLELDLHFSLDNVVVVWHDDKISDTKCKLPEAKEGDVPNPADANILDDVLSIRRLTYTQLQSYRCDQNPDVARFPEQNNEATPLAGNNYQIISLEVLLQFVDSYSQSDQKTAAQRANAARVRFNIETKRVVQTPETIGDDFDGVNPGPFENEILRIIGDQGIENRVVVQSFDHRSLWAIRRVNESIRLAALTFREEADLSTLASSGASIWSMFSKQLTPELIKKSHEVGLLVLPWTVNSAEEMKLLIDMGVDGIISDRPDILLTLDL